MKTHSKGRVQSSSYLFALFMGVLIGATESGCSDPRAVKGGQGSDCTVDTDCLFGLRCHDSECKDRSGLQTGGTGGVEITTEELIQQDQKLQRATAKCLQTEGCQDFGLCQGTPDGLCVIAEQSHCVKSKVSCGAKGFCTFAPVNSRCCLDAKGEECDKSYQ